MRVAALCSPDSWYLRDLQRSAGANHTVVALPFSRIHSRIEAEIEVGSETETLSAFDAVLVRTMPPGSLEQVVFRMDALAQLEAQGTLVINPPKAIEVAVDKYLALSRLHRAGFDVPCTETSQTVDEAMEGFHRLGGDVVVKPIFGSEGRGITRIDDPAIAERTYKLLTQLGAVIYQQEFVAHEGFDIRLLVIGRDVYGVRRINPRDWRTNVSRGASVEPLELTPDLIEIAQRATREMGAVMAGVDLLPACDGRNLLVEVNAVPGWRAVSRALGIDIASQVLKTIERLLR